MIMMILLSVIIISTLSMIHCSRNFLNLFYCVRRYSFVYGIEFILLLLLLLVIFKSSSVCYCLSVVLFHNIFMVCLGFFVCFKLLKVHKIWHLISHCHR